MIKTALVRTKPNENGEWDFVGVIAFDNLTDLFWTVDEVTDPGACEYHLVESGFGIFFDGEDVEENDGEETYSYKKPVHPWFSGMMDGVFDKDALHELHWEPAAFTEEVFGAMMPTGNDEIRH